MTKIEELVEKICKVVMCETYELIPSDRESFKRDLEQLEKIYGEQTENIVNEILSYKECRYRYVLFNVFVNLRDKNKLQYIVDTIADIIRKGIPITCLKLVKYVNGELSKDDLKDVKEGFGACVNFINVREDTLNDLTQEQENNTNDTTKIKGSMYLKGILFVGKDNDDCSVGIVRKMRDGVINDTGTCYSCPYFIPKEIIELAIDYINEPEKFEKQLKKKLEEREKQLYGEPETFNEYILRKLGLEGDKNE